MRSFTLISTLILVILSAACTSTGDDVTSPALPNLLNEENDLDGFTRECRASMRTIGSACVIYCASNSYYPSDLEALGEPYSEMTCPECGLSYELKGDQEHFALNCPLQGIPNHGSIIDGVASWQPGPGNEENACRATMRTIASQAVIFFAYHDRYPNNLEEMGMAGVVCPSCEFTYIISPVDASGNPSFSVWCPLPFDPNHGCIIDGIVSWLEDE
ncbi:MAG: hypothetical protein K8S62_10060 [Candidatus Sabulitectum sp.]|nr:hypothetical protein [Candidatus Sabulitectum sp.]